MHPPSKALRILVVDDETFILNLSTRILHNLGYDNIQTASDGTFGLGLLEAAAEPFDLVVCDLNMPEMDGIEFMRGMHGLGFQGALILLSGEDRRILETAMDLALALGLNILGALQKPLDPAALERLLARLALPAKANQFPPVTQLGRQEVLAGLTGAAAGELVAFYQPKVHMQTGAIRSVEALARWRHPERGLLGPGAFIPMAEQEGLIDMLSFAIYRQAVQQLAAWQKQGITLQVSVNFSINTFARDNFVRFLADTAGEYGIDPGQLMLEVTETQVMQNTTFCQEIMMRLRLKKFGLSIDDFGTGNSSLVQLKHIPFNELKIDRAFVYGAATNASARAILEASVELARKLDMQTVAEGAETREDWNLVEALGVDYLQGYYCARPMPGEDMAAFLAAWNGPH